MKNRKGILLLASIGLIVGLTGGFAVFAQGDVVASADHTCNCGGGEEECSCEDCGCKKGECNCEDCDCNHQNE